MASYCTIVGPQSEALSTSFGKWHLLLLQRLLRNNMRLNDLLPRPAVDDGRMGERSRCRKPGARFLDCRVVKPLIPRSTTVAAPRPVGGAWSAAGFPAQAHPEGYTRLPVRSTRRLWEGRVRFEAGSGLGSDARLGKNAGLRCQCKRWECTRAGVENSFGFAVLGWRGRAPLLTCASQPAGAISALRACGDEQWP